MKFDFSVPLANGKAPGRIVYMPEGEHTIEATVDGSPGIQRVIVDRDCLDMLRKDLSAKLTNNVRPVVYFDHKEGAAAFIPLDFDYLDGVGVMLKGEWTDAGRKAVEGRDYSYFSPVFALDRATHRPKGLLPDDIEIGSLVNNPAFESIARIAAGKVNQGPLINIEQSGDNRQDDHLNKGGEEPANKHKHENKHMFELLVKLGILTEDEAKAENAEQLAEERISALQKEKDDDTAEAELEAAKQETEEVKKELADCKAAKAKLTASESALKAAKAELAEVKASKRALIDAEIDAAVNAGKIAPKDDSAKSALRSALEADIKAGKALIESIAPNPAFATIVAGKTNSGKGDEPTGRERLVKAIESEHTK